MKRFRPAPLIAAGVVLLLAVLSLAALLLRPAPSAGLVARVSVDGTELLVIDLSLDEPPYEISLLEQAGVDLVLEVKDHAVRVRHSDCPDQICVHAGWLSRDMDVAICMPNRVAVVVSGAGEATSLSTGG